MNLGATLYLHDSVEAVEFYRDVFGMTLGSPHASRSHRFYSTRTDRAAIRPPG